MSDPETIWLEPECCVDREIGRLWAPDNPFECEDGKEATKYIRADIANDLIGRQQQEIEIWRSQNAALLEQIGEQYEEIKAEKARTNDHIAIAAGLRQEIERLRSLLPTKWYGEGQ